LCSVSGVKLLVNSLLCDFKFNVCQLRAFLPVGIHQLDMEFNLLVGRDKPDRRDVFRLALIGHKIKVHGVGLEQGGMCELNGLATVGEGLSELVLNYKVQNGQVTNFFIKDQTFPLVERFAWESGTFGIVARVTLGLNEFKDGPF